MSRIPSMIEASQRYTASWVTSWGGGVREKERKGGRGRGSEEEEVREEKRKGGRGREEERKGGRGERRRGKGGKEEEEEGEKNE